MYKPNQINILGKLLLDQLLKVPNLLEVFVQIY